MHEIYAREQWTHLILSSKNFASVASDFPIYDDEFRPPSDSEAHNNTAYIWEWNKIHFLETWDYA